MSGYSDASAPVPGAHTAPLAWDRSPVQPARFLTPVRGIKRTSAGDASDFANTSGIGSEMDVCALRPKAGLPRSRSGPAAFASAMTGNATVVFEQFGSVHATTGDQKRLRPLPSDADSDASDNSFEDIGGTLFAHHNDNDSLLGADCAFGMPAEPDALHHPKLAGALADLRDNARHQQSSHGYDNDNDMLGHDNNENDNYHNDQPSTPSRSLSHSRLAALTLTLTPPRRPAFVPTSPNVHVDRFGRRLTAPDGEDMAEERTKMLLVQSSYVKVDQMGNRVKRGVSGGVGMRGSGLKNSRSQE